VVAASKFGAVSPKRKCAMLYSLAMLMNACIDPLAARSIIIIDVLAIKMQSTSVKTDFIVTNWL
jgi:hypothetical protein